MEHQRFVETGSDSFDGDYLYDQKVPQEHFLRQIIEWSRFAPDARRGTKHKRKVKTEDGQEDVIKFGCL